MKHALSNLTIIAALSALLLGVAPLAQTMAISTTAPVDLTAEEAPTNSPGDSSVLTIPAEFAQVDKYVLVQNNQYVLSDEFTQNEDANTVKSIQQSLDMANQAVRSSDMLIDPNSKIASSLIEVRSLPSKTTTLEWYGVRNIYRSNAAIYKDINNLHSASQNEGSLSTATGVASFASLMFPAVSFGLGFLSTVSAGRSWVLNNWYKTLNAAQKAYPTKKIRWDVYWTTNSQAGAWNGN